MTSHEKLLSWVKDDEAAAVLISKIFEISQIADDFVDADRPMDKSEEMSKLLILALVEIPANRFYRENHGFLAPLIIAIIAAFNTSNKLQKNKDIDCSMFAWALRDASEHLITAIAYLKGGAEYALNVSQEVTEYFRTNDDRESWADWVKT
jgi:hypothetical protein